LEHWKLWREIGVEEEDAFIWKRYTDDLKNIFVKIRDEEDQLIWSQNPIGEYVPKIGYKTLVVEGREDN
jgi:hypothetical protein